MAFHHEDYKVGWICALPIELAAAFELLDQHHPRLASLPGDHNTYVFGEIAGHNVVMACLPAGRLGNNTAATVAVQMMRSFPAIRFGLLVGIGGGVPNRNNDIRLGDVVVSKPELSHGGVIQHDSGKARPGIFERVSSLNSPPDILLTAVSTLQSMQILGRDTIAKTSSLLQAIPAFGLESTAVDQLFEQDYDHVGDDTCKRCDPVKRVNRADRAGPEIHIHYGTIASGNSVMRSGKRRDQISDELGGVLCFEMEAAGLINAFPCLVVRGICDYADSHKNDSWQPRAAASAAAYAKELLSVVPAQQVCEIKTAAQAVNNAAHRVCSLPFPRNPDFVGRTEQLDILKAKLLVESNSRDVAIYGLGGVGKTQVALCFAYYVVDHLVDFSVFWISALSQLTVEESLAQIAAHLGLETSIGGAACSTSDLVKRHLSTEKPGRWLLIVDNADSEELLYNDDQGASLLEQLPHNHTGITLFTSRNLKMAQAMVGTNVVELKPLQLPEATDLLTKSIRDPLSLSNRSANMDLLSELHYLPLAIVQATAFINVKMISVSDYLTLIRATDDDMVYLLSQNLYDRMRYPGVGNAIATTWIISFTQIREQDPTAFSLLCFIACISWKAIPCALLPKIGTEAAVVSAIGTLCSYSFLVHGQERGTLNMHRLVHFAARVWLDHANCTEGVWISAMQHVAMMFPSWDWQNRHTWRSYLPHADYLMKKHPFDYVEARALLCLRGGECLLADGRMPEATGWLMESCRLTESLADDHDLRLWARHTLAGVLIFNGESERSVQLLHEVVRIKQQRLPHSHPTLLASQHELGRAYNANGKTSEAVALLEQVVQQETLLPADSTDRLASQHVLARAYLDLGKQVSKAISMLEHLVSIQSDLPSDDPALLESQHELARALIADGQIERAIEVLEHVLRIQETVLDELHPNRLRSQHVLGRAYLSQVKSGVDGFMDKVIAIMEDVVRLRDIALPESHAHRLSSQQVLADAHFLKAQSGDEGSIGRAYELIKFVVKIRSRLLQKNHPHRLQSKQLLAKISKLRDELLARSEIDGETQHKEEKPCS